MSRWLYDPETDSRKGKHACMTARGAKSQSAVTRTSSLSGRFFTNPKLRTELLSLMNS